MSTPLDVDDHSASITPPGADHREWDSPHCCSCCCDCCACHRISHAFWCVLATTICVLGGGVGLFVDGIIKQENCKNGVNYDDPASNDRYDACRQQAYVQLFASIALGGLFIILLFVSCCAFMDALCFRRWRSRPHMPPNLQRSGSTPRLNGLAPRSPHVTYDHVPPSSQFHPNLRVQVNGVANGHGNGNGNPYILRPQVPHTQPHATIGQLTSQGSFRGGFGTPQPQQQHHQYPQNHLSQHQLSQRPQQGRYHQRQAELMYQQQMLMQQQQLAYQQQQYALRVPGPAMHAASSSPPLQHGGGPLTERRPASAMPTLGEQMRLSTPQPRPRGEIEIPPVVVTQLAPQQPQQRPSSPLAAYTLAPPPVAATAPPVPVPVQHSSSLGTGTDERPPIPSRPGSIILFKPEDLANLPQLPLAPHTERIVVATPQ